MGEDEVELVHSKGCIQKALAPDILYTRYNYCLLASLRFEKCYIALCSWPGVCLPLDASYFVG